MVDEYNPSRPHSSLSYGPLAPEAVLPSCEVILTNSTTRPKNGVKSAVVRKSSKKHPPGKGFSKRLIKKKNGNTVIRVRGSKTTKKIIPSLLVIPDELEAEEERDDGDDEFAEYDLDDDKEEKNEDDYFDDSDDNKSDDEEPFDNDQRTR